ncbi:hypothetical protein F2Q69_00005766 [Brassica cretica]|uniref:Uncharacterized protein n=1 Tax=Brassica cretica TaxID=69181 RepID=A0A8S9P5F4_BRACR|nr:hypothetical protein F2Q69_00005766 [Brassica cretica]
MSTTTLSQSRSHRRSPEESMIKESLQLTTVEPNEYDEDYEEERATEYRAILDEEDKLLHHSYWKRNAPSIDMTSWPSIDTQPQQLCRKRTSTDTAYYKSVDTDFNCAREGDYPIGSWADEHHHESFAVETATYAPGADNLRDTIRSTLVINNRSTLVINNRSTYVTNNRSTTTLQHRSITVQYRKPLDPDGYAKAIDGRTLHVSREDIADIFQTANGADNLFMHQRSNPEQKATKECYDTAGGIDSGFIQRSRHTNQPSIDRQPELGRRAYDLFGNRKFYTEEKDECGVYRDDRRSARDLDGRTIPVHTKDIRRLLERGSRDEPAYICLPEHASSFTLTKLMKLDGVYYSLNDSISWLTTCTEEMKQEIARIQHATDVARPPSIDRRQPPSIDIRPPTSIDRHHHTSIDNCLTTLIDNKERLDGRCDDIYSSMDLSISALTSKVEAIQRELVEIQSYIARRPEASLSIDRRNNISTDIHNRTSVDNTTNQGRLVPKMTSDMSNTHYHGEEISADTYAALTKHQFNLESLGERLQMIENTTATMKDKWRRGDEAMSDFTGFFKQVWKIRIVLEISDDFGAFWRYLEQAPEMTIELDNRSILESKNRSICMSWYRSTVKRAESPFGHSRLEGQDFTILQDYP